MGRQEEEVRVKTLEELRQEKRNEQMEQERRRIRKQEEEDLRHKLLEAQRGTADKKRASPAVVADKPETEPVSRDQGVQHQSPPSDESGQEEGEIDPRAEPEGEDRPAKRQRVDVLPEDTTWNPSPGQASRLSIGGRSRSVDPRRWEGTNNKRDREEDRYGNWREEGKGGRSWGGEGREGNDHRTRDLREMIGRDRPEYNDRRHSTGRGQEGERDYQPIRGRKELDSGRERKNRAISPPHRPRDRRSPLGDHVATSRRSPGPRENRDRHSMASLPPRHRSPRHDDHSKLPLAQPRPMEILLPTIAAEVESSVETKEPLAEKPEESMEPQGGLDETQDNTLETQDLAEEKEVNNSIEKEAGEDKLPQPQDLSEVSEVDVKHDPMPMPNKRPAWMEGSDEEEEEPPSPPPVRKQRPKTPTSTAKPVADNTSSLPVASPIIKAVDQVATPPPVKRHAWQDDEEEEEEEAPPPVVEAPSSQDLSALASPTLSVPSPTPAPAEESDDDSSMPPPFYPGLSGCRSVDLYEYLNEIDEGQYGVVYRARDRHTGDQVALKRLKMEKEREGFPITSLREINCLLKVKHENIVNVREIVVGSNMDKIYIVMDYVEHDLKALLMRLKDKGTGFKEGEVKTLMLHLLRAVSYMHENWILHRDLKTSNLLLSGDGMLKVGDFGLAREYGSPLECYTQLVVTLWYRSPELLLGTKLYSTAVDMWSVGCIFAELLTNKPLFDGRSEVDQLIKIFNTLGVPNTRIWPGFEDLPLASKITFPTQPYNLMREKVPDLSDSGFDLLNKMLTLDPDRRISATDALRHPYFTEHPYPVDPSIFPTFPTRSKGDKSWTTPKQPAANNPLESAETALGIDPYGTNEGFVLHP